jgi:hypothetical protein
VVPFADPPLSLSAKSTQGQEKRFPCPAAFGYDCRCVPPGGVPQERSFTMTEPFRWCAALVALAVLTIVAPAREPEDKPEPSDSKAVDAKVFTTLRDVINRGADLYNSGETSACYRLYEGSLMTVKPWLDHKPDLQKAITAGLASAERDPLVWRRAFTLRAVLDKIRNETNPHPAKKEKLPAPKPDEKKLEEKNRVEKKQIEKKKPDEKNTDEKKPDEKKPDEKKPDEKKKLDDKEPDEKLPPPRVDTNPDEKKTDEKKKEDDKKDD